jgi:hypothetical protein
MISFLVQVGHNQSIFKTRALAAGGRICFPDINNKLLLTCQEHEIAALTEGEIIRIGPYTFRALKQEIIVEKERFDDLLMQLAADWSRSHTTTIPGQLSLNELTRE